MSSDNKNTYDNQNNSNTSPIKKKKKNKNKCILENCNNKISIIGECKWCNQHFCNQHRLPESHLCINLNDCKKNAFTSNQNTLNKNKTVAVKVSSI